MFVRGQYWIPSLRHPFETEQRVIRWGIDGRLGARVGLSITWRPVRPDEFERSGLTLKEFMQRIDAFGFLPWGASSGSPQRIREEQRDVMLDARRWIPEILGDAQADWWRTGEIAWGIDSIDGTRATWADIRLSRADIEQCVGVFTSVAVEKHASLASAETKCTTWLAEAFEADTIKRRTKSDFLTDARKNIQNLSEKAFNRVWARLAQEYGRNVPGAPSSARRRMNPPPE